MSYMDRKSDKFPNITYGTHQHFAGTFSAYYCDSDWSHTQIAMLFYSYASAERCRDLIKEVRTLMVEEPDELFMLFAYANFADDEEEPRDYDFTFDWIKEYLDILEAIVDYGEKTGWKPTADEAEDIGPVTLEELMKKLKS